MKRFVTFAVVAPLAACAGGPSSPDRGGSVLQYALQIEAYEEAHDGMIVLSGYYSSAATMWLGADGACIDLPASFGFHDVERDFTGAAREIYENHLPVGLRHYYRENLRDEGIEVLTGRFIIDNGWVPKCPK